MWCAAENDLSRWSGMRGRERRKQLRRSSTKGATFSAFSNVLLYIVSRQQDLALTQLSTQQQHKSSVESRRKTSKLVAKRFSSFIRNLISPLQPPPPSHTASQGEAIDVVFGMFILKLETFPLGFHHFVYVLSCSYRHWWRQSFLPSSSLLSLCTLCVFLCVNLLPSPPRDTRNHFPIFFSLLFHPVYWRHHTQRTTKQQARAIQAKGGAMWLFVKKSSTFFPWKNNNIQLFSLHLLLLAKEGRVSWSSQIVRMFDFIVYKSEGGRRRVCMKHFFYDSGRLDSLPFMSLLSPPTQPHTSER